VGGASLGFKTYQHTLVASYDRSAADTFGFAAGTVTNAAGSWSWHHPGSSWNLNTSFGEEQIRNSGFFSTSGWQASMGISETLNDHTNLTAQYVYLQSRGSFAGQVTRIDVHSARLSFGWSPKRVRH
jgi:hypothetical protein